MSDAYKTYTDAVEGIKQQRSDLQADINANSAQFEEALAARDLAFLEGDTKKADEYKARCAELDSKRRWLERDLSLLSANGAKHNPKVQAAGRAVLADNTKRMQDVQARWDHVAEQLKEHQLAIMELVAHLGLLGREGRGIRAQQQDVIQGTGLHGGWVSSPDDRAVNLTKGTGVIFMDNKKLEHIFRTGKI